MLKLDRRTALQVGALALVLPWARLASASGLPDMVVHKDASCSCCDSWAEHMRKAGFPVRVIVERDMSAVKARLGVPADLVSCHTAEIGSYVIEGHVPASAVERLLRETPAARGLSAPGMPSGSPGMESTRVETYDIVLFGNGPATRFARFRGVDELK